MHEIEVAKIFWPQLYLGQTSSNEPEWLRHFITIPESPSHLFKTLIYHQPRISYIYIQPLVWGTTMGQQNFQKRTLMQCVWLKYLYCSAATLSERVAGVELSLDKETSLKFTERKTETEWRVEIQSTKILTGIMRATFTVIQYTVKNYISHSFEGVSFVEVEDNFSICDVTVLKRGENVVLESKPEEYVITEDHDGESEGRSSGLWRYKLKIKFHADIFGSFKQTVVFDFGERPFLYKVKWLLHFTQDIKLCWFVTTFSSADVDSGRGACLLLVWAGVDHWVHSANMRPLGLPRPGQ